MATNYNTKHAELVNEVLSLPFNAALAWFRECCNIALTTNRPQIADYAREIMDLYCKRANGETVNVKSI
jgi:hypothetical protein